MAKSRARFLSELLGTTGLVKKSKSALAGADEIIDLSTLPSIPNSKLTNSSITINSSATSLGGSVTLTTANVAENTNLYYTDARADARITAADTGDLSEGSNLYYTDARADARVNLQTGSNLNLSSKDTGDLSEGSNLYYTNARADARIAAADTGDLSEGSNLYYTDARADARVALVVDSAPSTLNTLNELAAALGDDANFSTTVTNSIAAKLPLAGGTLTGNLSLGDNVKAQFGAGNDLQIYHDGSYSWIKDAGTGSLIVAATNLSLQNAATTKVYANFNDGGSSTIHYDGSPKIATTSTGIDVTGSVVADGLTVDGGGVLATFGNTAGNNSIGVTRTTTSPSTAYLGAYSNTGVINYSGSGGFKFTNLGSNQDSFKIANNGDISFYNDSAAQAFFFDSSTSQLFLGATSASALNTFGDDLVVVNTAAGTGAGISIIANATNGYSNLYFGDTADGDVGRVQYNHSDNSLTFRTNTQNALVIDSSQNATFSGTVTGGNGAFSNLTIDATEKLRFDGLGGHTFIQESSNDTLTFATGGSTRLTLDANATFSGSVTAGTISSGAITSSGSVIASGNSNSFGNTTITNLSATTVTTSGSVIASGNSNSFGSMSSSGTFTLGSASNVAAAFAGGDDFVIKGVGTAVGLTISQDSQSGTGSIFFGDPVSSTAAAIRYNHNTGDMAISAEDYVNFNVADGLQINGTTAIDGSRNITAGTIGSGAITSTGAVTGTYFSDGYVTWNAAQFNRSGAAIEFQFTPTNANWKVKIGANGDNPTEFNAYTGDADFSGEVSTPSAKLKAIAESNTDTAVDVFVYDTRKDSDGGAWRKRTQNTSWYNEALNTSTRGSRKEFPCVAVIISNTSTNKVTIYDGDDPNMPMWMVFTAGSNGMANTVMVQYTGQDKLVHMLNGILIIGHKTSSDNYGSPIINFISEKVVRADPHSGEGGTWQGNISNRNSTYGYLAGGTVYIVDSIINDIAMTVLPNAPIDADTGLPVPTIALATAGGVSIIKDDGNVYDSSGTGAYGSVEFIDERIVSDRKTSDTRYFISQKVSTITADSWNLYEYYTGNFSTGYPLLRSDTGSSIITKAKDHSVRGSNVGLSFWDWKESDNDSSQGEYFNNSLMSYVTSDYNTGWMHGDIKLAALSDTDTTNAVGTELVTNGDFSTGNLSGWTLTGDVTPSYDSGTGGAKMQTAASFDGAIYQAITATAGVVVTWDVDANTSGYFGLVLNGTLVKDNITTSGSYSTASTISSIQFAHRGGGGGYGIIDNVSVRLAKEDRSVNGNGLQVFGTIAKDPVATGAELVGYSGFSSSNYLQQPYNADLQFGTGDFSIACWVKAGTANAFRRFISIQNPSGNQLNNDAINIKYAPPSNGFIYAYLGTSEGSITTAANIPANIWQQVILLRSSGTYYLYLDGTLASTKASTQSKGSTSHVLRVGVGAEGNESFSDGSIALVRISKTAPSAEQIAKMYNDEKHLFQTNAKATLYGSSDAITALAYDDDTELLHAGTSAGRSVFQGLNRVDNTTDAVGAAISASNGFIVEE